MSIWKNIKGKKVKFFTEALGDVEAFPAKIDNGMVIMDNGFEIPEEIYEGVTQPADGIIDNTNEEMPNMGMQFDKNGMPVLPPSENGEEDDGIRYTPTKSPDKPKPTKYKNHQIISLIDKAKKTDTEIGVPVNLALINKALFDVLVESYGVEAEEDIIEYQIDNLDFEELKDQLKQKLREHYSCRQTNTDGSTSQQS